MNRTLCSKKHFIVIYSRSELVQCAITGIRNRIFSEKNYSCTIPSNEILGLYPSLPYCKDIKSSERIYYLGMEIWSDFTTNPQNFGCR